jgi:hypothetical protein
MERYQLLFFTTKHKAAAPDIKLLQSIVTRIYYVRKYKGGFL